MCRRPDGSVKSPAAMAGSASGRQPTSELDCAVVEVISVSNGLAGSSAPVSAGCAAHNLNPTATSATMPRSAMKPAITPAIEYGIGPASASSALACWRF